MTQHPVRRKAILYGSAIVALGAVLAVTVALNNRSQNTLNADVTNSIVLDDPNSTLAVNFKVTNSAGAVATAFVDAIADTNANCEIDSDETNGYAGETQADGSLTMNLPDGLYNLKVEATENDSTTSVPIAVRNVDALSCTKRKFTSTTTEALTLTLP